MRGLPPRGLVKVPPPADAYPVHEIGDVTLWAKGGTFFGDGSGGDHSDDPILRRVGYSTIKLSSNIAPYNLAVGLYGAMPGRRQTVPRAELYAVIQLLENAYSMQFPSMCCT